MVHDILFVRCLLGDAVFSKRNFVELGRVKGEERQQGSFISGSIEYIGVNEMQDALRTRSCLMKVEVLAVEVFIQVMLNDFFDRRTLRFHGLPGF